ncbi:hypothetical protein GLAREA_11572 [Glarea lozoyensis ATCC 20868]|uniref:Uncharacterized protein n=1 Tax=Glarea lozoyensis (strain ATCC 20868 / MF5171) TaxID=1116229 RepID=S3CYT1_GLAL2|nr:uncharacterized protein GLAREA_11572 [Glarea lozoyensis ATCC 20868]EPE24991.1 hypothetical protein GLAREA_11572 [Glarea lozoyensis ATCC 20868]
MYINILTSVLLGSYISQANAQLTACNRDNCLRAIIASNAAPGPQSASADCVSFFKATVTPSTSTIFSTASLTITLPVVTSSSTVIVTSTTTAVGGGSKRSVDLDEEKRAVDAPLNHQITGLKLAVRQQTVIPSRIPVYASACSGAVRYSSACSCIGVIRSTTTVATPVGTTTITLTATQSPTSTVVVTSTAIATATGSAYALRAVGSTVDGQYVSMNNQEDGIIDAFTTDISSAARFNIGTGGKLLSYGRYRANTDNFSPATIFFNSPGTFTGTTDLSCSVGPTSTLTCTGFNGANQFQLCPSGCTTNSEPCNGISLATSLDVRCQQIGFVAVPVV